MKNLKKFQAFALTQEEQKNVKGGKALVKWWRCWSASSNTAPINHMGDYNGDQAAVTACNRNPNCVGCELLGE